MVDGWDDREAGHVVGRPEASRPQAKGVGGVAGASRDTLRAAVRNPGQAGLPNVYELVTADGAGHGLSDIDRKLAHTAHEKAWRLSADT